MTDWTNPTEATWLAAIAGFITAVVAVAIALMQGYTTKRVAKQAREARAWQQALLIEPIILHVSSKLAQLPDMINDAVKAGAIFDRRDVDSLQVDEIEQLGSSIPNVDALDDPLRTDILRLVAWTRSFNKDISGLVRQFPGLSESPPAFSLNSVASSEAIRNRLATLQKTAQSCAAALRDFINAKGKKAGVTSLIASPLPQAALPPQQDQGNPTRKEPRNCNDAARRFLELETNELRLKWAFDHVKNYGVAATVIGAGIYLLKYGALVNMWPHAGTVLGLLLLLTGMGLFALNVAQAIWALAKSKVSKLIYFAVSIFVFLASSELVWAIVGHVTK